ncbi:ester cyclase [Sphingorhabdus sp.]|jgi:predicted ester cyclase|uniref:ester cyclase n=1 Tax=Sphingorhabdus sp. TaxID=1902408 RepID=UPI0037C98239
MTAMVNGAVPNVGGRDISQILASQGAARQDIPGFDPEYADIVDYILRCTHRIWEQKDVGLIATHYGSDIVVHMMTGPAIGMDGVIAGTSRTLSAFPDRTLTGEAVIWSDEGDGAYLSSHRITSTATNLGTSELGPATGKRITFTTIADCLCKENLIIEEWLVRDYSHMALQLGFHPREVARTHAAADKAMGGRAEWRLAAMARVQDVPLSAFTNEALPNPHNDPRDFAHAVFDQIISQRRFGRVREAYSPAAHWNGPGGRRLFGWGEIAGWFTAIIGSFGDARINIQHVAAVDDMIAVRWELTGTHDGGALYGAATGEPIYILAVTHWRIAHGLIVDEVTVFDEVATMRQMEGGL